jgi:hypothetical protein
VLAKAELTQVSPLFQFDHAYINVIAMHFSPISPIISQKLSNERNISEFSLDVHRAFGLLGDPLHPAPRLFPVLPFLRDLFALPWGNTLVFP